MSQTRNQLSLDLKSIVYYEVGEQGKRHKALTDQISTRIAVDAAYKTFAQKQGMSVLNEMNEFGAFDIDTVQDAYDKQVKMRKFGLAAKISNEAIADNQARDLAAYIGKELKRCEAETLDIHQAELFNEATNTAARYLYLDGKPMLSTTHESQYNSQSNRLAVDADLSEDALEDIVHLMNAVQSISGRKEVIQPDRVIIHPDQLEEYIRITAFSERYATTDRDGNANKKLGRFQRDPITSVYLSDTDAIYVLTDQNSGMDGFVFLDREPFSTKMVDDESTDSFNIYSKRRHAFFMGNWRSVFGTVGAA